ncbi:hypothetical protein TRIUR3_26319 [Triticum urartu]|uniref:Uncharacterized protein n=2 Tax=Triticum TaxID=4564 RepID=A0A9R0ZCH1_TRITD|nr:hypothetical protein TRIUR3_26319 [Triticum urartu]VAI75388.1 unnamed protein product [Triticum turgidum subsp. durum]
MKLREDDTVLHYEAHMSWVREECKQTLEQESNITARFPAAVQEMDIKSLEEEYKGLQGDGAGEAEYFQSLEEQIIKMKVFYRYFSVWLLHDLI